jgi:hypothetical protein
MDKDILKIQYNIQASLREASDEDYEDLGKYVKGFALAAGAPPPTVNGKPRMLFTSAWIAHEGRNQNGDAFVGEEIRARVNEGLFIPPYSGMIDLDHDFTARGFWYKTAYAFDERADKWGIFAHGALWAWRYAEVADSFMAQMHRDGFIEVSMSALSDSVELTTTFPEFEGTHTRIIHNPVFFSTALLTVPPGDKHAQGLVTEDPLKSEPEPIQAVATNPGKLEEFKMEKELLELKEAIEKALDNGEASEKALSLIRSLLEAEQAKIAQLAEEKEELAGKLKEVETEKASLEVALETVNEVKVALETELTETKEALAVFEAERKASQDQERLDTRLSELPDAVVENLEKHPEKEEVLASWKNMDEAQWTHVQRTFALASASSLKEKSQEEGQLGVFRTKEGNPLKTYLK